MNGVDVLGLRAHAERHAAVLLDEPDALDRRLVEVRVAAEPGEVDRRGEALAGVGKIGLSTVLWTKLGDDLADHALAARADQQRIAQERVAREHRRVAGRASLMSVTRTRS